MINQPLLITAHFEKIIRFFNDLGFDFMVGAFPLHKFPFGQVSLAADTVKALVVTEINVTPVINALEF